MKTQAYRAVRSHYGAAFAQLDRGYIEAIGRDRLSYLQGQVSNDVAGLTSGQGRHACLLNNTGHLLAELFIYELGDRALIETDRTRVSTVIAALERFVIRERVSFDDVTEKLATITVQGAASIDLLGAAGLPDDPAKAIEIELDVAKVTAGNGEGRMVIRRDRTGAGGYDLISNEETLSDVSDALWYSEFAVMMDNSTANLLRIEAQKPEWGSDLDETIIPLEAGLDDAISYTKGCYVGQEIIARIHSRGHVNKQLSVILFEGSVLPGEEIAGVGGARNGERIGRVTSAAAMEDGESTLTLGYLHTEYSNPGARVAIASGQTGEVRTAIRRSS